MRKGLQSAWHWTCAAISRIIGALVKTLRRLFGSSPDQMPENPPATLVERFRLVERGRQRGKNNAPAATQPGLDPVEMEVVDHCTRLFGEKKDAYRRATRLAEQRSVQTAVSATDADAAVEEACERMRARVNEERPELTSLHRSAQKAIDDLREFKVAHHLSRDAHVPKNLTVSIAILAALLVGETLINGLFFGANLAGSFFVGVTYAALISVINVGLLGVLGAYAVRQMHHRSQSNQVRGYLLAGTVFVLAIVWNLAVAHYREALPPDYPPSPEVVRETASDAEQRASECWRGLDEEAADGEALCLLLANGFRLDGFESWMLMMIGLLMCGGAMWKWLGMSDLYPGFGRLEKRRQETEAELLDERHDLLDELSRDLKAAVGRQHSIFADPAKAWERATKAHEDLKQNHDQLCDYGKNLEGQCQSAIETYRSANREAPRAEPEPAFWSKPWTASWEYPEAPSLDKKGFWDRRRAKTESEQAHAERDGRLARLRQCAEACKADVEQITRLSYE